jgi:hypothetical protein
MCIAPGRVDRHGSWPGRQDGVVLIDLYKASRFERDPSLHPTGLRAFAVPLSNDVTFEFDSVDGFSLQFRRGGSYVLDTTLDINSDDFSGSGHLIWTNHGNVVVVGDASDQCLHLDLDTSRIAVLVRMQRWEGESGYTQVRVDEVGEEVLVQYECGSFLIADGPTVRWHVRNPWGYFPGSPSGASVRREFYNSGIFEIRINDGAVLRRTGPDEIWRDLG